MLKSPANGKMRSSKSIMPPAMLPASGGSSACLEATSFESVYPLRVPCTEDALMAVLKDLTGERYSNLVVLRRDENGGSPPRWICRCDCGKEKSILGGSLRAGKNKSCGCKKTEKFEERAKKRFVDLTGKKFGALQVVHQLASSRHSNSRWLCRCECGREVVRHYTSLKTAKSCGCLRSRARDNELVGERFGRLLVISRDGSARNRGSQWLCQCECGLVKVVDRAALVRGRSRSCGCLAIEQRAERFTGNGNPRWREDLSDAEREQGRDTKENHLWVKAILSRDDYTCATCSVRGGRLAAHHLDGWDWCAEKRYEISNGVTLCIQCHNSFHSRYGRGGNTADQFANFMEAKQ